MTNDVPPSSRNFPPPSSRPAFPLLQKSAAMSEFADRIIRRTRPAEIVPVILGPNRLELRSLIDWMTIRLKADKEYHSVIIAGRTPSLMLQDDSVPDVLIYPQGEKIETHVQARFGKSTQLMHTCIVAFIPTSVDKLLEKQDCGPAPWSKEFANLIRSRLCWPEWKERKDDHLEIIQEIHRRLTPPPGLTRPSMSKDFEDLLLSTPYVGTDQVEEAIKNAFNLFIRSRSRGKLHAHHLVGPQKQRALEERGDVRPSSNPPAP